MKYLCPHCIANGKAAAKFDATFVQDADELPSGAANAQAKTDELFKRTPGYFAGKESSGLRAVMITASFWAT